MEFTYLRSNWTFWVRPVTQVAMAIMRVTTPKEAWTGTNAARNAAVAPSQHSRIMKLKNPTTNCKNPELCHIKDNTRNSCWKNLQLNFCSDGVLKELGIYVDISSTRNWRIQIHILTFVCNSWSFLLPNRSNNFNKSIVNLYNGLVNKFGGNRSSTFHQGFQGFSELKVGIKIKSWILNLQ